MAKIIMADGSEIRGKIGGKVYSRNGSGAYVRKFVKPINKNTTGQNNARNIFSTVSQAWRTLTEGEKQSFEDMRTFYPRTDSVGNTVTPSASQLFNRINGQLMQIGVITTTSLVTVCPVPVEMVNPFEADSVWDISSNILTATTLFSDGTYMVPADCIAVIEATPSISAGIKRIPLNSFSRITTVAAGDTIDALDITAAYNAKYGGFTTSGQVSVKVTLISLVTGMNSNTAESRVVQTP